VSLAATLDLIALDVGLAARSWKKNQHEEKKLIKKKKKNLN
jgi:hypothetical protein